MALKAEQNVQFCFVERIENLICKTKQKYDVSKTVTFFFFVHYFSFLPLILHWNGIILD